MDITLPFTDEIIKKLRAGDRIRLSGVLYTARDAAHKRMNEALKKGEELPFDVKGATIYYAGPTPAKPGRVIGSCGPTTSGRMDAYTPNLLDLGLKAMIGKGQRSDGV
ncbi:MAG: fumarate hydratase C-terminal domain-containing protein, partial [Clostridia bacterium]|nr:fumarate hydratase C-terminal domain-containing protein [Clostridia bacterium]